MIDINLIAILFVHDRVLMREVVEQRCIVSCWEVMRDIGLGHIIPRCGFMSDVV